MKYFLVKHGTYTTMLIAANSIDDAKDIYVEKAGLSLVEKAYVKPISIPLMPVKGFYVNV